MPLPLLAAPAVPWVIGGITAIASGVGGWFLGFFGSDSIKNLSWAIIIVALLIVFYFLRQWLV